MGNETNQLQNRNHSIFKLISIFDALIEQKFVYMKQLRTVCRNHLPSIAIKMKPF